MMKKYLTRVHIERTTYKFQLISLQEVFREADFGGQSYGE